MHAFLSNLANRQTDRQTNKQTNTGKNVLPPLSAVIAQTIHVRLTHTKEHTLGLHMTCLTGTVNDRLTASNIGVEMSLKISPIDRSYST